MLAQCGDGDGDGVTPSACRTAIAVIALGLAVGASRAAAGSREADDFSSDELHRLDEGQLVERRVTVDRGELRLMGGTSWQVIEATPDMVWAALLDTDHYSHMLPQLREARVVRDSGDSRTLFLSHGSGIARASYYLDVHVDRGRRSLSFRVDDSQPHGIRAAWGFYTVRPYTNGRSLLVYGVMADIGDGLVHALLRSTVHEWMMKVPWMVKQFVEGSGRGLYENGPVADSGNTNPA
jgi:hypothetical protein